MVNQTRATATPKAKRSTSQSTPTTFIDHIHELRSRLFWVALWFIVASGAVFPFFNEIIKLLMMPLGHEKLYYLTPVGGLSFALKICLYVGFIAVLPVLMYHLYRFISPVMKQHSARQAIGYVSLSFLLAITGVVFAYTVSLPAAMHFLTHFGIAGVSPMLTVDSYLSFITSYLLASALLFQLPLIMLIIDSITPKPPSFWGKYERHMIVAAFIIAMLITPTPNISDQVMMAVPMIIMYQIGIGLVYLRHRTRRLPNSSPALQAVAPPPRVDVQSTPKVSPQPLVRQKAPTFAHKSIDFKRPAQVSQLRLTSAPPIVVPPRSVASKVTMKSQVGRSVDGIIVNYTTQ